MNRLTSYINKTPAIRLRDPIFYFVVDGKLGGDIADRLAGYEDSGLTPEEVNTIAFRIGLLGKKIYFVYHDDVTNELEISEEEITDVTVKGFWTGLTPNGQPLDFDPWSVIGEEMFFTRSDAEAFIEGMRMAKDEK